MEPHGRLAAKSLSYILFIGILRRAVWKPEGAEVPGAATATSQAAGDCCCPLFQVVVVVLALVSANTWCCLASFFTSLSLLFLSLFWSLLLLCMFCRCSLSSLSLSLPKRWVWPSAGLVWSLRRREAGCVPLTFFSLLPKRWAWPSAWPRLVSPPS